MKNLENGHDHSKVLQLYQDKHKIMTQLVLSQKGYCKMFQWYKIAHVLCHNVLNYLQSIGEGHPSQGEPTLRAFYASLHLL